MSTSGHSMIIYIYRVTLKDVKAFLPRVNCKVATNRLRELFQEIDTRNRNELGFDDFVVLYHKLMFDQNVSSQLMLKICIIFDTITAYTFIFTELYRLV